MSHEGPGDFCKPHGARLPCEDCRRAEDVAQLAAIQLQLYEITYALRVNARERTAATILAALVNRDNLGAALSNWDRTGVTVGRLGAGDQQLVAYSVALTDALRAALAVKP